MRQLYRPRNNSRLEIFLTFFSLLVVSYNAWTNTKALYSTQRGTAASEQIARQLETLNHSHFMEKLNCELDKEKEK